MITYPLKRWSDVENCNVTTNFRRGSCYVCPDRSSVVWSVEKRRVLRLCLKKYREGASETAPLFCGRDDKALSCEGLNSILGKYVDSAKRENPALFRIKASAYTLRHSKAMHTLQNVVPLVRLARFWDTSQFRQRR